MAKGSIEKRGTNSWRLVVELGTKADGSRDRQYKPIRVEDAALLKTTKKLRDYLEDQLAAFKREVLAGNYFRPEKMTLSQFIENEWIPKYASNKDNLSPLTLKTYKNHIDNHIAPALGHRQLSDINTMLMLTFINNLSKPGNRKDNRGDSLSNGTIEYIYRVIKNILSRAKDWNLIKENPLIGVKKPRVEQTEFEFYDEEEAKAVIQALYQEPRKWRLFVLGAMIGGCRRGELIGLSWADVDFNTMSITVNKSISLTTDSEAVVKDPKTKSSKRTIDMPEWYMNDLIIHKREWELERKKAIVAGEWEGGEDEYVFHAGFGKPFYYSYPTRWWSRFVTRHELKRVRFHDLRHSSATLLIEAGASMKAVQQRLGHAKHQTTADIYAHVTKKLSRDTAQKFDKFAPNGIRPQSVPKQQKPFTNKSL